MPVSEDKERLMIEAIQRLVNRSQQKAADDLLVDRNLVIESGVSKATLYRCPTVMDLWREAKEKAVWAAIGTLTAERGTRPDLELTDADLRKVARVDHASFNLMSDAVIDAWNNAKAERIPRSRRQLAKEHPDEVINSLVNKLYAVTLALRHAREIISSQAAEIERLGGNVIPITIPSR